MPPTSASAAGPSNAGRTHSEQHLFSSWASPNQSSWPSTGVFLRSASRIAKFHNLIRYAQQASEPTTVFTAQTYPTIARIYGRLFDTESGRILVMVLNLGMVVSFAAVLVLLIVPVTQPYTEFFDSGIPLVQALYIEIFWVVVYGCAWFFTSMFLQVSTGDLRTLLNTYVGAPKRDRTSDPGGMRDGSPPACNIRSRSTPFTPYSSDLLSDEGALDREAEDVPMRFQGDPASHSQSVSSEEASRVWIFVSSGDRIPQQQFHFYAIPFGGAAGLKELVSQMRAHLSIPGNLGQPVPPFVVNTEEIVNLTSALFEIPEHSPDRPVDGARVAPDRPVDGGQAASGGKIFITPACVYYHYMIEPLSAYRYMFSLWLLNTVVTFMTLASGFISKDTRAIRSYRILCFCTILLISCICVQAVRQFQWIRIFWR